LLRMTRITLFRTGGKKQHRYQVVAYDTRHVIQDGRKEQHGYQVVAYDTLHVIQDWRKETT
jgi:ribosomal protein S16